MDQEVTKEYSNGEITIIWKPSLCMHSTKCWKGEKGLLAVFNPKSKPWINPGAAPTEQIVERVSNCPSGALSFIRNGAGKQDHSFLPVQTLKNGPLIIKGEIKIQHHNGEYEERSGSTAFCRCGMSANKPYCDGSHNKHQFEQ